MPVAAINEDAHLALTKDEIGIAAEGRFGPTIFSKSQAKPMSRRSQLALGRGSATRIRLHNAPDNVG